MAYRLPHCLQTSRKWWIIGFFCVIAVFSAIQSTRLIEGSRIPMVLQSSLGNQNCLDAVQSKETDPWTLPESSLNFPHPTTLARENLRNESYYITSFAVAGFTNEFIAYMHLIYLGLQTGRIPIVPPIIPAAHVSVGAGSLPFQNIFNMSSLRNTLRHPIIEWADVKARPPTASVTDENVESDPTLEHFGCWSTRPQNENGPTWVRGAENLLKIDMSFSHVPAFAFWADRGPGEIHTTFPGLAAIIMPKYPHDASRNTQLMSQSRFGSSLAPDQHLACFDFLYFVTTGISAFEFQDRWSAVWNTVGTHLRFSDSLVELAQGYVHRALRIDEAIPPMITVHIRRGDFGDFCPAGKTPPCFLPLERYRAAVDDIQKQVLEKHQINVTCVLAASDEVDPTFWDEVSSFGWSFINHTAERTVELYGEWYPLLVDKATLSMGIGFVGTQPSTFSILNARRVEDWNNGITRQISVYE